jgi:predicted DNA-binding transcriptional regulator YafY
MDKTERLFAVMDALRRHRRPVTAQQLADEQAVSVRTLYRDIQTLIGLGAPIDGEAGIGYMLRPGFFLPPLMFTPEELEALVLGAQWVQGQPDDGLSAAARNALGKIATASPDDLRDRISNTGLWAAQTSWTRESEPLLGTVRKAMRAEKALHLRYADEAGNETRRPVWPVTLAYYEDKQIVGAWCTLRQDFRNFRIDRVRGAELGTEPFGKRRVILLREWEAIWSARTTRPDTMAAASREGERDAPKAV